MLAANMHWNVFSASMKYELEDFGIKVILIEPGAVNNNFLENSKQTQKAVNPDSPYAEISKKVSEGMMEGFKQASSSSPMQVAEVILTAIKSDRQTPNTI
jgi:short-subunit dehydrogenase